MFASSPTYTRHAVLLALTLITGCAAVTPPSQITASQQALGSLPSPAAQAAGIGRGQLASNWWQALADTQLDTLLQAAMLHNHQRQAALATVRAARHTADAVRREALPQGSLNGQAQRQQLSSIEADPYRQGLPRPPIQNLGNVQQSVSWELDLFGRAGTAAAIAERQADIQSADLHAATLLLQADVVRQYTRWQQAMLNRALLLNELDALQQRHTQLQHRQQAGLTDQRDVLAAAGDSQQAKAELAANDAVAAAAAAALAVLCGNNPLTAPQAPTIQRLPEVPSDTDIVYPDDMLLRRPDVARADAQLRISLGEAVLADRAYLPHISLNLAAGVMAPFGQLDNADALRYALGPAFSWDWLDAGRRAARRAGANEQGVAAWHHYEQTVLIALQEGESSLRQWKSSSSQLASAEAAARLAEQSAVYSRIRSQTGLEPQSLALAQHVTALQAQRNELAARAAAIEAYVQVQLALGAWQAVQDNRA
ncbi:TPA: TolC family protein [Aeromonas hydrophila]